MKAIFILIALFAAGHTEASIGLALDLSLLGPTSSACTKKLDIVFAVDGSSSICGELSSCPNWNFILQFIHKIVESLTIGPHDAKVSFVTAGDTLKMEWDLNKYTNKVELLSAIDNVVHPRGEIGTSFVDAAASMASTVFNMMAGDRGFVNNIAIIISDGALNISPALGSIAIKRVHLRGIKTFMICITERCTEEYAQGFASDPKLINVTYFMVDDFPLIDNVRENLMKQICAK